ncbi:hypothetical protein B0G62_10496 [Paraburkholderia eburnea]|uniref:Uncharacterized protein n=1 Tax=Paraburkholderia eburnea TaxID=1189126 RepID=A0A2S4MDU2_9BURK|nr:hypothetical protein [Paraburkholderia eburnea]POR52799.1 hypothetical protein B0G62_10496 [Paraburkholderia eburnea]PRZ23667.1 hypothetical protein BX588_10496 [Paraburkholderia eburnea]
MNEELIRLAREAGLSVQLDAVIGSQQYSSISGSLDALRRFGDVYSAAQRPTHGTHQGEENV